MVSAAVVSSIVFLYWVYGIERMVQIILCADASAEVALMRKSVFAFINNFVLYLVLNHIIFECYELSL